MKRASICLWVIFAALMLHGVVVSLAEVAYAVPVNQIPGAEVVVEAAAPAQAEPTPFSWAALATVAGCAAATLLIVQFTKSLIPDAVPTRVYVYFWALAIMLAATYFTAGLSADSAILVILNSFVAATSALGAYDLTFARADARGAEPPG